MIQLSINHQKRFWKSYYRRSGIVRRSRPNLARPITASPRPQPGVPLVGHPAVGRCPPDEPTGGRVAALPRGDRTGARADPSEGDNFKMENPGYKLTLENTSYHY